MKKAIIIVLLIAGSAAGYLCYDWYAKAHVSEEARYTVLYAWTDSQGQAHFTDQKPPSGAKDVKAMETLKPLGKPLALQIRDSILYQGRKLFAAMTGTEQEKAQAQALDPGPGQPSQATIASERTWGSRKWPIKKKAGKK